MARGDLLFSTNDLWAVLQAHESHVHELIDSAEHDKFLGANFYDLVAAFSEGYEIEA